MHYDSENDHNDLQDIYDQAELAMGDDLNTVVLTVLKRQGNEVVMQEFHDIPQEGFPEGDAAVLHIDPAQGESSAYMVIKGLERNPQDHHSASPATASEEKWLEVYVRLVQAAAVRPRADQHDRFAQVPWDAPAPASKADVRRRLRP